jgi:two-component system cell cycle sensor histidine kinase/response regulator CckA
MSRLDHVHHAESLLGRLPLVSYMLELDAPASPVYISAQIEELFGVLLSDLERDPQCWTKRIVDDDREGFVEALRKIRADAGRMEIEYRLERPDGSLAWVRDSAFVEDGHIYGFLVDVTREKEVERELALGRATLDAFFSESSIGLAITDAGGRYVRINDALARFVGEPADALLGRTLADAAPEVAAVVDPLLTGHASEHQVEIERETGRPSHFHASFVPFEVDGELYHGRAVVDLSEQRRAEAAEQRYRQLVEQLPLVSYVNDVVPHRRASFVSPQIYDVTGYSAEEFVADPTLGDTIIHPDDFEAIVERERNSRQKRDVFEHEYRIIRKDGAIRWVLDRMESVIGADGAVSYEQGFLVDITERQETAALLRAVWDGAQDAMVIADDHGRYVDANPAACRLFGRSYDELIGLQIWDVVDYSESSWDAFRAAGSTSGEGSVTRPDGERREIEGSSRANVMPGRHLAVLRDVTERKQLEADLWRAQKLESVGRLAGGVAHDFNNLLTAIRGYAQLLEARAAPASTELRYTQEIDRAADRAAALTAQLLALGRRQTLRARPVDLNRHLEGMRGALGALVGGAAELVLDLAPDLRGVRVDAGLRSRAIETLVVNAGEAAAPQGRVVVATRNSDVAGREDLVDGRYVVMTVADDGPGLDDTALEHVFEPFFTTKDASDGLGLASAYGTVRQSGGTIAVESELGAGTTFTVYLPEASGEQAPSLGSGTGETVLVVERDPAVRDVASATLADASYRVLTARTAADAVAVAERFEGEIDLLLTDVDELRETPLAALLRERSARLEVLKLAKPYTSERLRSAARAALAERDGVRAIPLPG